MKSLKIRVRHAITLLKITACPLEPEEKMAFSVVCQAIEDLSDPDPDNNSRSDWDSGHLTPWCEVIGLDSEYVFRVLHEQNLI
jgi:hypothetical protein